MLSWSLDKPNTISAIEEEKNLQVPYAAQSSLILAIFFQLPGIAGMHQHTHSKLLFEP